MRIVSSTHNAILLIFSMAYKACSVHIFTLRVPLGRPATRGDTSFNSSGADKDNSGSDKKQDEGKDRETSGRFP